MQTWIVKHSIGNVTAESKIKARTKAEAGFYAETQGLGLIKSIKPAESRLWILIYPVLVCLGLLAFYQVA